MNICRQCFRENANDIGFLKVRACSVAALACSLARYLAGLLADLGVCVLRAVQLSRQPSSLSKPRQPCVSINTERWLNSINPATAVAVADAADAVVSMDTRENE